MGTTVGNLSNNRTGSRFISQLAPEHDNARKTIQNTYPQRNCWLLGQALIGNQLLEPLHSRAISQVLVTNNLD